MAFKARLMRVREQQCGVRLFLPAADFSRRQVRLCNLVNGTDPIAIATLPKPSHYAHVRYRIYCVAGALLRGTCNRNSCLILGKHRIKIAQTDDNTFSRLKDYTENVYYV